MTNASASTGTYTDSKPANLQQLHVAHFEHVTEQRSVDLPIDAAVDAIRHGEFSDTVAAIHDVCQRQAKANDALYAELEIERNELKKQLPLIAPTLTLNGSHVLDDDSLPSGLVQLDIDVKENVGVDFSELKSRVAALPDCFLVFNSPSCGLKIFILTDFYKHSDDTPRTLKARFIAAYKMVEAYVRSSVKMEFDADGSMAKLRQLCYLSHDPDVYFNPGCLVLAVDEQAAQARQAAAGRVSGPSSSQADDTRKGWDDAKAPENVSEAVKRVQAVLADIPRNLPWDERRPINWQVIGCVDEETAVTMLMGHWAVDNAHKLEADIRGQIRSYEFGGFARLCELAEKHSGRKVIGRARRTLKPVTIDDDGYEPLTPLDKGMLELKRIISNYFDNPTETFINVSAGSGKTEKMLSEARALPWHKKVLILVPTHQTGEEYVRRLEAMPPHWRRGQGWLYQVNHIKGQKWFQDAADELMTTYGTAGVSIPVEEWSRGRGRSGIEYQYTKQFNQIGNIRIMTHDELRNSEARWAHGCEERDFGYWPRAKYRTSLEEANGRKRRARWSPDYVVIDENWLELVEHVESRDSVYECVAKIIDDTDSGMTLVEAVQANSAMVENDYKRMADAHKVEFTNRVDYLKTVKSKLKAAPQSEIMKRLYKHIKGMDVVDNDGKLEIDWSGCDEGWVRGMRVINGLLTITETCQVAGRYKDVPKLWMDATADQAVIETLMHDVAYHSIKVETSEDVHVRQVQNCSFSRQYLSSAKNRDELVTWLTRFVAEHDCYAPRYLREIGSIYLSRDSKGCPELAWGTLPVGQRGTRVGQKGGSSSKSKLS